MSYVLYLLALIPFYLIGTIPSGRVIAKLHGIKIEEEGSGNVGATNVARIVGKKAGLITLLIDIIKGFVAPLIGSLVSDSPDFVATCGVSVVLGHCLSLPGFLKGGKGVATGLGVLLFFSPLLSLISVIMWVIIFSITRIVSISSIISVLLVPFLSLILIFPSYTALSLCIIGIVIVIRHKENIKRLVEGREARFT